MGAWKQLAGQSEKRNCCMCTQGRRRRQVGGLAAAAARLVGQPRALAAPAHLHCECRGNMTSLPVRRGVCCTLEARHQAVLDGPWGCLHIPQGFRRPPPAGFHRGLSFLRPVQPSKPRESAGSRANFCVATCGSPLCLKVQSSEQYWGGKTSRTCAEYAMLPVVCPLPLLCLLAPAVRPPPDASTGCDLSGTARAHQPE